MKMKPGFQRDIANYLSGRVVLVLLGFVTFPIITRMLSVAEYGVVSLTLRVILMLTVLSKCGLQYSASRFYDSRAAAAGSREQRRFYSTLVLGPSLTAVAVVAVFVPGVLIARSHMADPFLTRCLLLAPALVVLRTIQSILLSLLRNEGRSQIHSVLEVMTRALTFIALLALLVNGWKSAFDVLAATAVSEGIVVFLQLTSLFRRRLVVPHEVDWRLIRSSLIFGAPLIAYELSSIVLDSGDRLLVRHFLGDTSLGYYSAAYNVSGYVQDTVMTPLNLAIFPIYMRIWNEQGREATQVFLSHALTWFTVIGCAVVGLSILCSRDAITLLASARFVEAHRLLPILIPSLMLYATHIFLNVGLILEKRTTLMAALVFCSALVNLALNVYLIPRFGIMGGAWSTLLSYLLLIVCLARVNQSILPLAPNYRLMGWAVIAATVALILPGLIRTSFSWLTLLLRGPIYITCFVLSIALLSGEVRRVAKAWINERRGDRKHLVNQLAEGSLPVAVIRIGRHR